MSAFFLSINRDGSAFKQAEADMMMKAIDHFGCDARKLIVQSNFALGYQSLWTVPEEQGEQQPLLDSNSQTWFLFYGRIDNRAQLIAELDQNSGLAEPLSDAALMHTYYLTFGEQGLGRVIGPFVLVLFDPETGAVTAARDAMGGRHLVVRITERHIHIATYELALVAHSSVEYRFNEQRLGRLLANIMEDQLSSTVAGLDPLNPGELVRINVSASKPEGSISRTIFYRHDARKRVRFDSDQEYALEFRRLLDQAVQRRMRSIGNLGSLLSGGFDSVPISILMAEALNQTPAEALSQKSSEAHSQVEASGETVSSKKFTALSWVHDRYPEADERQYSSDICQRFDIEQVCINCDDVWPTLDPNDEVDTHLDPVVPFSIPYTEYHQAAFREAQRHGIKTVMTGIHGDLLYGHSESVLAELLCNGHWRKCIAEFRRYWQTAPSRWQVIKHFVIKQIPGVQRFTEWRRLRRSVRSECLQESILEQLSNSPHPLFEDSLKALRPQHYRVVFGGFAGEDMAMGRHMEAKYQLERRYPFRDRDLCEFMSGVPSDQLHFNFTPRPIVRNAFKRDLGEAMLARRAKTQFDLVVSGGIKQDQSWRPWFNAEDASWQKFVKHCYFEQDKKQDHALELVKWRCAYYDYWKSVCYTRTTNELGINNDV